MNYKNLIVAVLLVAASVLTAGCVNNNQATEQETNTTTQAVEEKADTVELVVVSGGEEKSSKVEVSGEITALEVLKKGTESLGLELTTKKYDFGTSVEGIGDDMGGTDNYYWLFYVNGAAAQVGVDSQKVKAGDKVEFKYEESSF